MLDKAKRYAGLLGLPAGLAMSSTLGSALAHFAAPKVYGALPHVPAFNPTPEGVTMAVTTAAAAAAPLAIMPAVRMLQNTNTLPRWASAPVGVAVAIGGVGHYIGSIRALLLAGAALPTAVHQVGFVPIGIGIASILAGIVAAFPPNRKTGGSRVARDKNGRWQADYWKMAEARKVLSDKSGLILGEACVPSEEPDRIGVASLLKVMPKGHIFTAAGSGAGKLVSSGVPACLSWTGPLVVHDPAGEVVAIVRSHREALGRKVRVISLDADTDGCNILDFLDVCSKRFAQDVRTVIDWLEPPDDSGSGDQGAFAGLSKSLAAALIMFVMTTDTLNDHDRTLIKVRQLGASPNLRDLLRTMSAQKAIAGGAMANAAGLILTTMESAETFGGVAMHYDHLTSALEGTEDILCGQVASEKRFALADILEGTTDLFICLPADMLHSQPQIARTLLGALATLFLRQKSRSTFDTLFIVDEMPLLGKMDVLRTVRDFGRKFGLYLWVFIQNADSGEVARGFRDHVAHGFRFDVAHHSGMKSPTF